jgi:hypothetical protein
MLVMSNNLQENTTESNGYWYWIQSKEQPPYEITGKYLFFSENQKRLIEIAKNEIENHGFHVAKVNSKLLGSNTDYVLCLYYADEHRKMELSNRHDKIYSDVKYRYWKSDEDTLKGKYSSDFLEKLSEKDRKRFTNLNKNED